MASRVCEVSSDGESWSNAIKCMLNICGQGQYTEEAWVSGAFSALLLLLSQPQRPLQLKSAQMLKLLLQSDANKLSLLKSPMGNIRKLLANSLTLQSNPEAQAAVLCAVSHVSTISEAAGVIFSVRLFCVPRLTALGRRGRLPSHQQPGLTVASQVNDRMGDVFSAIITNMIVADVTSISDPLKRKFYARSLAHVACIYANFAAGGPGLDKPVVFEMLKTLVAIKDGDELREHACRSAPPDPGVSQSIPARCAAVAKPRYLTVARRVYSRRPMCAILQGACQLERRPSIRA